MFKKGLKRSLFIFLLITLSAVSQLQAASNSPWYDVTWGNYGGWLANASQDLNWGNNVNTFINFGQVEVKSKGAVPPNDGNLRVKVTTPTTLQLINVEDHTKAIDVTLKVELSKEVNNSYTITQTPFTFPIKAKTTTGTYIIFYISFANPAGYGPEYEGSYSIPVSMQILDNDDNIVSELVYSFAVFYKKKSQNPSNPISHLFLVDQYTTAEGIDVVYLQQHPYMILPVGSATFTSTTNDTNISYSINIAPSGSQGSVFQFVKNNNPNDTIPYKVTAPSHTTNTYTQSFSIPVVGKNMANYWLESVEIGIRDLNYLNRPLKGGLYESTIVITLVKN